MANPYNDKDLVIEDARIRFRNFSGKEGQYNRAGDRNFCLLLDDNMPQVDPDYWNVKFLKPREEGDAPQAYIHVSVGFPKPGGKGRPPRIVMITSRGKTALDEDMVSLLDWAEIKHVDLIIRPYEWLVNGKTGVKAYLKSIYVTIEEDELEMRYADVPDSAANTMRYEKDEL